MKTSVSVQKIPNESTCPGWLPESQGHPRSVSQVLRHGYRTPYRIVKYIISAFWIV
jgi:hypothetical protein